MVVVDESSESSLFNGSGEFVECNEQVKSNGVQFEEVWENQQRMKLNYINP